MEPESLGQSGAEHTQVWAVVRAKVRATVASGAPEPFGMWLCDKSRYAWLGARGFPIAPRLQGHGDGERKAILAGVSQPAHGSPVRDLLSL